MVILGFALLLALCLGVALFLLSLLLLGVALGLQLFIALAALAPGGGLVVSLATGVQLAGGSAFLLALVLIVVGMSALLFPPVLVFLRGMVALLRLAAGGAELLGFLVPPLRAAAAAMRIGGGVLSGPASTTLTAVGDKLIGAGDAVPEIPTVDFSAESLWLRFDQSGSRTEGFLPQPPLVPNVEVVTSLTVGQAPVGPIVDGLKDSGNGVKAFSEGAETVGSRMHEAGDAIDAIADLLEQATQ